ncbi:ATP-dependent dethiobiotin synthetase BioD 1 [Pseudoalteromonas holothuriae]|uniref:ATP-dependent dethiobiotin synthetase BioD n=1 Tax=Pseudoalteromonas holothuriae TaxID=2963714 RepID=A0A9W4QY21_9GAMM|nr:MULTISPECIES: dethiobiotin synthase [unclassified Pseudoalteromonas]CAH9058326.1 ATP-dependent dethiobiotin synthetase BioD 1 [Pseudoalteromonas sp. CIP111854]CAH9058343.1 ATP-dependent dethiobiotin synthetase BioD 1 [Pseudoalteromonas sp. CIP111951]
MSAFFITGTDTEVGKTYVTALLLKFLTQHKRKAIGFKPIAAGAEEAFGQLVNDDALTLMESSSVHGKYEQINPICFEPPIAPHIAAQQAGVEITLEKLSQYYHQLASLGAEFTLVEGAGGWALPINDSQYLYDWVKTEQLPVILVVGMKLGCLNHAILTSQTLKVQGVKCVGWVANQIDPNMTNFDDNLNSLRKRLEAPLLAVAPFGEEQAKLQIYAALTDLFGINLQS